MRKLFFLAVIVLFASCEQKAKTFLISGTASSDLEGALVYLVDYANDGAVLDSVTVKDGVFSFTGLADTTTLTAVKLGERTIFVVRESGGTISVDSVDQLKFIGTPLNNAFADYMREVRQFSYDYKQELATLQELYKDDQATFQTEYEKMDSVFTDKYNLAQSNMYEANKNNALGEFVFLNWYYELPGEKLDSLLAEMNDIHKNHAVIKKIIDSVEKKKLTAEGKMFTDFTIENGNIDGSSVSFSDYIGKGKYVLVDFWASWCGPCKREIPNLAEVYKQYHGDKFDVLSIAVWDKRDDTMKAIKEHKMNWSQIVDAQRIPTDIYGIEGIPQIILFGPDGTIIARNLRGEALKTKIAEVLAQ